MLSRDGVEYAPSAAAAHAWSESSPAALEDEAVGPRSWLYGPGLTALRRSEGAAAWPQAFGRTTMGRLPATRRSFHRQAAAAPAGGKPIGRLRRARSPMGKSAAHVASGLFPGAVDRRISGWLAFPWCRLPLPLGALFGPEGAACGRVDALVAIVPANPIARRGIAAQHFLDDTREGAADD
jgi:hypothetical protein